MLTVSYLKNLCQLHFFVVKYGMDAVNSLLGLVGRATLCFLMQDGNQSPDGHKGTDISMICVVLAEYFFQSETTLANAKYVDLSQACITPIASSQYLSTVPD